MPAGRPPAFENDEQLDQEIQQYFNDGVKMKTFICGKPPNQYPIVVPVPTITGLAIYLGFESRQSFYDYEKKPEFSYTIKRARLFIENEYEQMLYHGNIAGAIFALKNFGWTDKQEIEKTIKDERIDESKLSTDDLRLLAEIQRRSRISPEDVR